MAHRWSGKKTSAPSTAQWLQWAARSGVGFSRGIGADLVLGDGSTGPAGIVTGAADSGVTTANPGKLVLGDFTNVFYSVNKAYRESDKAAWLVNDAVAKMISNCVDDHIGRFSPWLTA